MAKKKKAKTKKASSAEDQEVLRNKRRPTFSLSSSVLQWRLVTMSQTTMVVSDGVLSKSPHMLIVFR